MKLIENNVLIGFKLLFILEYHKQKVYAYFTKKYFLVQ
jgi:hypothetical protein